MTAETEASLLARLHVRLDAQRSQSTGRRWVIADHVRCDAGFYASRTIDAVAMDTWPSNGLPLHGFEVKTSRSDWLRELAQPQKAAPWRMRLDYLWLVADVGVVNGDLPEDWGLLVPRGSGLRQIVAPVRLRPAAQPGLRPDPALIDRQWSEQVDRGFVAALLRALARQTAS